MIKLIDYMLVVVGISSHHCTLKGQEFKYIHPSPASTAALQKSQK